MVSLYFIKKWESRYAWGWDDKASGIFFFVLFSSSVCFFLNFYSVTVTDFQSEKAILTHIFGDFSPLSIVPVVLGSLCCSKASMKKDS